MLVNNHPTLKVQRQKKVRKLFSPQEDAMLMNIMFNEPFQTWIAVAEKLPGRTARQCRDRWVNYLAPSNKNGPWSSEEDELLAKKYLEHGPQWTTISKFFDGRSENNVKNRWYTYVKHQFNKSTTSANNSIVPGHPERIRTRSACPVNPIALPSPVAHIDISSSFAQKPILPPISVFESGYGQYQPNTIKCIPAQRFRSESVQPFAFSNYSQYQ
ncbi:Myb-like DNA-binding domain containing protein [Trichomonas vaginalis G3]|uniref:Myb-like DNA-binding domain containing protein n=1 Tax=Trichomonas vaginalis (strain ATCC PRA-98 / G3) TaxID=412133 RepID=A2F8N9_TRIV3|nr:RNA polymerase II transcription regulator recruiting protein [Trichomonas vaginalis G3]EAX98717.1 Myb-like DNA-binding domain containing protein [Trichomonas vaginalis G3]KAI5538501.1 RNA polymerase II transcription regulator recruiting protein [Trichomonas vaginalis G3]|eukprot:XP_001311647.1 Myb-like DNA-binding domain containing protein [Trichomonas vaginalis G3]